MNVPDLLDITAGIAHGAEVPTDPDQAQELLDAVDAADRELRSLATRLRIVLTGGEPCGTPPDMDGLCQRCGHRIAAPVGSDKPGCMPFKLALRVVRLVRWTRLTIRTLCSPSAEAFPRAGAGDAGGRSVSPDPVETVSAPGTTPDGEGE